MAKKPTYEELEKRVQKLERDCFEYKQAKELLRQSKMKYRLLAESATDVICVISLDRFVLNYVSPSVESVFGYKFEELMNLNIYDFLTPDSANHVMAILEQEIEKDQHGQAEPQRLEIEVLCKDGLTAWAEVSARFLRDDKKQIISILCVLRDVSERKKLEDELLENKEKFQSLYNDAPDMYFTVSPDGIIISVNQFGAYYLGYSIEELAGNLVWKIVYKDDLRAVQNQMTEIFNQKLQGSELEFRKIRKDGSILWVHERTRLILDENDSPVELRIICRDVTIQKQAEIALRKSEEKYRNIIEKLDDIIWMSDLNLRTTYVSPSIEKKLGFTPEERMAQDLSVQVTPASYAHITELFVQELNREKEGKADPNRIIRAEVEYYHKNGSILWLENIVSGLRDENGVLVGVHGV
ncbi:MAG: PAS domain S-box protein, partial [Deltaproteobacteria bacterium]|nr:PAS domain S-box protein [Deltaproteobacteria bacterium]